jgi:D-tyrosyl-tRNA(Tyr) deacylase
MKAVVQRVSEGSVSVGDEITGQIEQGLVVLLGVHRDDTEAEMKWIAEKLLKLRIFPDEEGKMNRSVSDIQGSILLISQFTLYGNLKKGTRPSFVEAAEPEKAEDLYNKMIEYLKKAGSVPVETGRFGAKMDVKLTNDGPVTIILQR